MERAEIRGTQLQFWVISPDNDLLTLTPDLSGIDSAPLFAFAAAIRNGTPSRISLRSFDLLFNGEVLLAGNSGNTGIAKRISQHHWNTVVEWLTQLARQIRGERLGLLATIPRETLRGVLLQQNYEEIVRTCETQPELATLCADAEFWRLKASALGGVLDPTLPPREAYLKLLTQSTEECYPGSEEYTSSYECIQRVARKGRRDLVEYFLGSGNRGVGRYYAIRAAALANQAELVEWLLQEGAPVSEALPIAQYGHLPLVTRILEEVRKQTPNLERNLALWAALGAQTETLDMLESNADIADSAFVGAAGGGHIAIMQRYLPLLTPEYLQTTLSNAISQAAQNGKVEAIDYIISLQPADVTLRQIAFDSAADSGQLAIMQHVYPLGIRDINDALTIVLTSPNPTTEAVLDFLVSHGADVNLGLREAAGEGDLVNVNYFLVREASDIQGALNEAVEMLENYEPGDDTYQNLSEVITRLRSLLRDSHAK